MDIDQVEELTVERLHCLGWGGGLGHQFAAFLIKFRPPTLSRLVEACVRQDVVEKQLLRQLSTPRELRARLHRQVEIFREELAF